MLLFTFNTVYRYFRRSNPSVFFIWKYTIVYFKERLCSLSYSLYSLNHIIIRSSIESWASAIRIVHVVVVHVTVAIDIPRIEVATAISPITRKFSPVSPISKHTLYNSTPTRVWKIGLICYLYFYTKSVLIPFSAGADFTAGEYCFSTYCQQ